MKIKTNDTVKVISGKDRGKIGKVLKVIRSKSKVVVAGVNVVKKHQKAQGDNKPKGIIEFEAPIDASNVMYYDNETKKASRVGFKIEKDKKVRVFKANNK